jgi:protein-arginine kinase activator protein McsA
MLCEVCQQKVATVHLTTIFRRVGQDKAPTTPREQHFCEECADTYYAQTPGMNSSRKLICLSDFYRFKLYDLLEAAHPEAFDNSTTEACRKGSELMCKFLREHLTNDGIELNEDGFKMLCSDFFGSHHFYTRENEYKKRKKG